MVQFTTVIKKFDTQGEKTGWTYIEIPKDIAEQLVPGNKKGFRVKGYLDKYQFEALSLLPMGGGNFILALNAAIRKAIHKKKGAMLEVKLQVDHKLILPPAELMECLADEPKALANFNKLSKSHQNYYTRWINEAKTEATKAKRIAQTVNAMTKGMSFGETMRSAREEKL